MKANDRGDTNTAALEHTTRRYGVQEPTHTEDPESMAKQEKASKGAAMSGKQANTKEALVVVSKVRAALRSHDVNVASDAAEALNDLCHWYIEQAARRATANGRKTVRAHDFTV